MPKSALPSRCTRRVPLTRSEGSQTGCRPLVWRPPKPSIPPSRLWPSCRQMMRRWVTACQSARRSRSASQPPWTAPAGLRCAHEPALSAALLSAHPWPWGRSIPPSLPITAAINSPVSTGPWPSTRGCKRPVSAGFSGTGALPVFWHPRGVWAPFSALSDQIKAYGPKLWLQVQPSWCRDMS